MKTPKTTSERLPASASSARWARTIIKLEKFGRKWVTISCLGWSSERTAKIGLHELPRTIKPLAGSYIIAMATIEAKRLQVSNIEPDSQKTSEDIDADWKAITQNRLYGLTLKRIPEAEWPKSYQHDNAKLTVLEVWRSSEFLAQVIHEKDTGAIRVTVNRAKLDRLGITWEDGITWDELMQVKTQIGRGSQWAIEIFPADEHVVNVAAMRHLWLLDNPPAQAWLKQSTPQQ